MREVKRYRWHDDGMWWLETEQDRKITAQWVSAADYDALAARVAWLEKDAARYRFARAHWDEPEIEKLRPWDDFSPDPDQLDAQLDSAMDERGAE